MDVFEVYRSLEDPLIDQYSPESPEEFPERSQIVSDFFEELQSGRIEEFQQIDHNPDFVLASEILSRACSRNTKDLTTIFLRRLMLELSQLYGNIDYDSSRHPRYEHSMKFRADSFEAQLALLLDFIHGKSMRRLDASIGGLIQSPDFNEPATIPLSADLALELRGLGSEAGTAIGLTRRLPLRKDTTSQPRLDASERHELEVMLTLMRVYWGLHLSIDEVIERPPFSVDDYRVIPHFYHTYPHYRKVTSVNPSKLEGFVEFWKHASIGQPTGVLEISLDRLQRHVFAQETLRLSPPNEDRLIDLVIACDALLGEAGSEAVRRLSQRFACFMRMIFDADPIEIHTLLVSSYRQRSDIVHGVKGSNDLILSYPFALEDVVRAVTGALLLLRNFGRRDLLLELDTLLLESIKGQVKIVEQNCPCLAELVRMHDCLPIYPNSGEPVEINGKGIPS